MEAVEFLQCYYKMCKSYVSSCVGCEAQGIDCELTTGTPERLVAIVEKWAKEHPEEAEQKRTNKDALLAAFPNARVDNNGIPYACPNRLDADYNCDKFDNCFRCKRAHWLSEVKE